VRNRLFIAVVGAVLAASVIAAQSPRDDHGRNVSRVGDVTFANSGAPAAQASFLFGLAQLHNFEYDDAARAFREAQQTDPGFAMAFWGEAMTKNHPVWMEQDLGGARRVLDRLGPSRDARIAKGRTERERAYLAAVEELYGAGDKTDRDLRYLGAMKRIHSAYPDDVDAAAFYGLALLGSAHEGRDERTYMQAAKVLEEAFATHQNHPGLAHYLIHSYDDPAHAASGLPAARRYSAIAPAAPHALHMTSHIYLAAGMWDEVVLANERATGVAADRARAAGRRPSSCGHANMWLMYGYLQQGRPDEARRVLDACRVQATGVNGLVLRAPEEDPLDPDNIPAASYIQMWSRYLVDTGEWTGELASENLPLGDLVGARLTRAYVRGLGAAARHDAGHLDAAVKDVRALRPRLPGASHGGRYVNRGAVLEAQLVSLQLLEQHRSTDTVSSLKQAAADEDAMPVEFGPPFIDKPTHELLADVLLALKRPKDAAVEYRAALARTPGRALATYGLANSTRLQKPD
jgi:tetratricopeptide (TPR) repeat protein